ncbi:MAG: tetratricopeptide repeat protein [Phycisphaerae bacterium]|jgi:predicted Zn-dependent protease|nr:tetratricopeptide repeat protein [Phycisphaerae bacterium]
MARSTRAKRRLTLLGILLGSTVVAGAGSYAGVKWYRARQVEAARIEGYAKFDAGDYAGALDHLSAYVAKNQNDADALLRLAKCRFEVNTSNRRNYVDAAHFYRAVLGLRPGNVEALNGLMDCYGELGYGPELLQVADDLLRIEPNNVKAIEVRMQLAGYRGAYEEAIAEARKLIVLEPDSYQWRAFALESMRKKGDDLAIRLELLRGWMNEGEKDGRYRLMLSSLLQESGDMAGAEREAREAANLGMPDSEMLGVLVDLLDLLELPDVVEQAIDKARAGGVPEADLVTMQIKRHWLAGRFEAAKQQLERVEKPDDALAIKLLRWTVLIAETEGDAVASDAAIAKLRALYQASPATAEAGILWLDSIQASRDATGDRPFRPSVAMGLLQRAIAANPKDTMLLMRAGDVSLRSGETDEAVRSFVKAFEGERRRWIAAGVRSASAYLAVGRTTEAFLLARELSRRFPSNPSGFFVLAQTCDALAREGRSPSDVDPTLPREATASFILQLLYDKLGKNPVFAPPLIGTLVNDGEFDRARDLGDATIADPKASVEGLLQIAVLLADRRYGDIPTRAIDAASSRAVDPLDVAIARAKVQIVRGDFSGAKLAMQGAISSATEPASRLRRAELFRIQAQAAIAAGDSDLSARLAEVLREGADDLESITFVLEQQATWDDEGLVHAAIARLSELIGETSPRTVLTNAARVLRFKRTVPQDVAKSIQSVDAILASNGDSTAALVTLARLFSASQPPNLDQAVGYLKKAIELQPGRRDLYPELISHLQTIGNFADASKYLQQYMGSAANDPSQSRMAAGLMIQQGQFLSAIPTLDRVARQTNTESDRVALAEAERRAGRSAEAERAYRLAIEGDDRSALSALAYAEFLARAGRLDDARAMIDEDAARTKPALTPANRAYLKARLELDFGDPALAAPAVSEAVALAPNSPGVALLAARQKLAAGDAKTALEYARKGLAVTPKDQHLLAFVSSLLLADPASRADSAQTLDQLKAENPALGELLTIVKACAAPDGTVAPGPDQLAALNDLTSKFPGEPSIWTVAIELHVAAGKFEEAIRIARRGMTRLPTEPGPAEFAARLLLQERRTTDAREAARTWRTLAADSPIEPDLLISRIALIGGKPGEAVTTLRPYEERLKRDGLKAPESLGLYAAALLFDGKTEAALEAIKENLVKEAAVPNGERRLLTEWLRAIRTAPTTLAIDALGRSEAVVANDDTGHVALATEYVALARRKNATQALERARVHLQAISPQAQGAPIVQLLGADLAAIAGDVAGASSIYQGAWEGIPAPQREQLMRWAGLDESSKQPLMGARSIALFVSNNQASMLAKAGSDLDTAVTLVERALAMAPEDPSILETKAEVLLARKDLDGARKILTALLAMPSPSPSVRLTLARVELAAGRVEEARRMVDAASATIAEDPFADRVLVEQLADVKAAVTGAKSTASKADDRAAPVGQAA